MQQVEDAAAGGGFSDGAGEEGGGGIGCGGGRRVMRARALVEAFQKNTHAAMGRGSSSTSLPGFVR